MLKTFSIAMVMTLTALTAPAKAQLIGPLGGADANRLLKNRSTRSRT